jgi:hypothetical protein
MRGDFPAWIPANYYPLFLLAYMLFKVFSPRSGSNIVSALPAVKDVIFSPFSKVTFYHGYVGDVLTSIVKPMVDLAYTFCFVFSGDWLLHLVPPDSQCLTNFAFTVTPPLCCGHRNLVHVLLRESSCRSFQRCRSGSASCRSCVAMSRGV